MSWEVSGIDRCGGIAVEDDGESICVVTQRDPSSRRSGISWDEARARAQLIATAPALLESLSNLLGLARLGAAHLSKYHAALEDAEAIIAEARGEQ